MLNTVPNKWSRRSLLKLGSLALPFGGGSFLRRTLGLCLADLDGSAGRQLVPDSFPTQPPELTREIVTVSHFDLKRVKELVEARPSLARAAWDWGFGDWESALGAASHMGNRAIAEYLISQGARPSLFSAAMLGQVEVVRAFVAAQPGVQRIRGPHGISLFAHAKAGGEAARPVFDFLQSIGDADAEPPVALSDADIAKLIGTYAFGLGASQQIDVTFDRREGVSTMYSPLTWTRKGSMGRPLVHLGDRVFYPAGAPSLKIRFKEKVSSVVMTIHDPELVLVAHQAHESK
jgi:hypothetical protein